MRRPRPRWIDRRLVSLFSRQLSHLFNVAHTLRLLVQKERSLDILKVGGVSSGRGGRV